MAREKHVGRKPANINPFNEDRANAGDGHGLAARVDPGPGTGTSAVPLTAGQLTYAQNFDSLASSGATGSSLPADWTFSETGGAAPATYSVGTGSGTTGDTWSFGIAGTSPVSDRAFGSLASTTVTQILIGASFANMSGATVTAILISYVGEQWRRGGNTIADRLDFQISFNATSLTTGAWTDVNGLDFVSLNASASALTLDGNAAANRLAISFNIAGVSVANGATFWIRWIDTNIAGNDDGLAIDNFALTATVNRPPVVAAAIPDHHGNEDEAVLYTIPAGSFSDPDGNPLTLTASRADNAPLPSWLVFTAATRTFSGTPPANFNGTLSIKVTASDGSFSVSDNFDLIIDPVNDAAIIGGTDTGAVTEDGNPAASGQLTISDVDAGENAFQPVAAGTPGANGHGIFEMRADGGWTYALDNEDPSVQALHAVDTLADMLTVLTADGTSHVLSVTIHGANEASATPYARAGDETLVNSSLAGLQSQPSVAFLADGRYVIVFQVFDGDQLDVRGRIFNRDGSPAASDFGVNLTAGGEQHLPQVAALSDGGFVVVWQDSAGGSYDIKARIYEADGSAGGEIPIASTLANETAPAVAALPGGGFVALWIDDSDADGDVRGQVFMADGNPAGDSFAVNAPAAGGQVHAAVAVLAGGTIVAVWEDGAAGDVRMRLFSEAGSALTDEITANGGPAGSQGAPCVAALTGGGYAIAWMDGGADGDGYGIYARLFEADGDPAGAGFRVNTLAAGDQTVPSIAALPDGGFILSWADGAGPDADDIRAQRFDAGGVPVDAELLVNGHADGVQSQPAMAANIYGTLVVAWNDASSPGVGGDDDGAVVQVLLTPGGAPPAGPTPAVIGGEDTGAVTEDIAPGTSGTLTITDPDAGEARLVAQADASGSNGYGLFQINADGSWTYSIAGSALADTIPGGETRTDSIIVSAIDGTTHSVAVTITGTNDAPVATATPGTTAYFESVDAAPGAIAVDDGITVTDVDDTALIAATVSISDNFQPGQDILAFDNDDAAAFGNIASVYDAGSGVLSLNSAGGTATLAQWQAALRAVTYSNGSEEPGQATRTVSFAVYDGDSQGAAATRLLSVAARNDSPSGANSTVTIDEDSVFTFTAAHFGFTDADGDAFAGVRFGAAPAGGTLCFDAVAVAGFPTTIYSAADIAAGRLSFVPAANLYGAGAASLGFTVVDDGGTMGAGRDADAIPKILGFDIVSVNDQPSGADKAIDIDEDAAYTLTLADFGYGDVDGNAFEAVIFSHPVGGGMLYIDGSPMMSATLVHVATIDAGGVVFVPAANATGTLGGIAFRVRDDGGTGNGGQDTDQSPAMIAFTVAAINDAPTVTVPGQQAIDEAGTLILTGDSLVSVADIDAAALTVTLAVGHGLLTLSGTSGLSFSDGDGTNDVTMTFTGTVAAINAALDGLAYDADADHNGADTLSIHVTDGGQSGTGPAGTDSDTIAINITAINDAPVVIGDGTESATTINEDTPGAGQTIQALFAGQYSDAADNQIPNGGASSPGQFSGIAVTANGSSAATGQWQYFSGGVWTDIGAASDGAARLLGDPFVTLIRFNPAPDFNGTAPTLTVHLIDNSLPFAIVNGQVVDLSGPGATGGTTAYSAGTVVLSQTVNAVNDAPLNMLPGTQTIDEDASITLSTGSGNALAVSDVDATTLSVTLSVAHGALTLASIAGLSFGAGDGTADTTMTFSGTAAAINAALGAGLTYAPAADFSGSDAISVVTTDDGQTDSDSIAINIAPVNDAPSGTSATITLDEDGTRVLTLADFGYGDPAEGDGFAGVAITTLPGNGILLLDGAALLVAETFVTAAQLAAGQLVFRPDADQNGTAYATLTFQVRDDGGTGNGGQDTDQSPNMLTFDIAAVNDAPSGTDRVVTGSEDDPYVFAAGDFGYGDPVEGHAFLAVRIATLPLAGDILLNGAAVTAGDFVAVSAIEAGMLTFQPAPDAFGAPYASFTFQVQDDGGTAYGGVDTDATPNRITINITPDNLAPLLDLDAGAAGVDAALTYTENDPTTPFAPAATLTDDSSDFAGGTVTARLTANGAAGDRLSLRSGGGIAVSPTDDTLTYGGVPIGSWGGGVDGADLVVQLNANATAAAVAAVLRAIGYANLSDDPALPARTIAVEVADGDGGAASAQAIVTLIAVDDAAVARDDGFTLDEAASLFGSVFADHGAGADADADGPGLSVAVVNGASASVGRQILLASGALLTLNADGSFIYATNHAFDRMPAGSSGASNAIALDGFTYTLAGGGTATVTLAIAGLDSDDILFGTAGADVLAGGNGDDVYFLENDADRVIEDAGRGFDTIFSSAGYALAAGAEVEVLSAVDWLATAALGFTGNGGANIVYGNAGANTLDGGGGADILIGFGGDDRYFVDTAADVVIEGAGQGFDSVFASASYALAAGSNVEVLSAVDWTATNALSLIANGLANVVYGNGGANSLDGGGGADVLIGFGGDDIYFVDTAADIAIDYAGQGYDTVYASASHALAEGSHVEILSAIDWTSSAALNLTGNSFANTLYGNDGANILDGGGGSDALVGRGGADTFAFTTALGAGNVDTIVGFVAGTDRIALDHGIFTAIGGGMLAASAFVIGTGASDADDRIVYDSATGALLYDADGNGAGVSVQFAALGAGLALTAADFQMI